MPDVRGGLWRKGREKSMPYECVVWIVLEKEHESTKMPEETCLVFGQDQEGKKIEKKRKKEQLYFLELGLRKEAVVAEL